MAVQVDFCTDCTDPASISVDDSTADCDAVWKAELACGFLTKCADYLSCAEVFAILFRINQRYIP